MSAADTIAQIKAAVVPIVAAAENQAVLDQVPIALKDLTPDAQKLASDIMAIEHSGSIWDKIEVAIDVAHDYHDLQTEYAAFKAAAATPAAPPTDQGT
jgi:hypothetical protein